MIESIKNKNLLKFDRSFLRPSRGGLGFGNKVGSFRVQIGIPKHTLDRDNVLLYLGGTSHKPVLKRGTSSVTIP